MKKKVIFFIDSLGGGGAERVASVLSNELAERGYSVDIVMMHKREIAYQLNSKVKLLYAEDMKVSSLYGRFVQKSFRIWNRIRFRVYIPALRRLGYWDYPKANETSFYFYANYAMPYREYLKKNKGATALGFLIRSNIAMLYAAKGVGVETVFCERNNPVRPDIARNIIKIRDRIYKRCDKAVFQTEEERDYYSRLKCPTKVILNPIKENLPDSYKGERRHEIVNFCRLNKQKNIPLLVDAFEKLYKEYPDYTLRIYGRGEEKEKIAAYIREKGMSNCVFLNDFAANIHELIRDAAMFVSTSDFEGLSNSMIEAMAIGLPCVCTDCAGGGAGMMIQDHVNGLLVPCGNAEAVYQSMKEIIESKDLAEKLSEEASGVKRELDMKNITDQWEEVILNKEFD